MRAYNATVDNLTGQVISGSPIVGAIGINRASIYPSTASATADAITGTVDLSTAYTTINIYLDGWDVSRDWTYTVDSLTGMAGSFGTGVDANKFTVTGFDSITTSLGKAHLVAQKAGYTPWEFDFVVTKAYKVVEALTTIITTGSDIDGLTTTPVAPVLSAVCKFTTAYLQWNRQADLTGQISYRIYKAESPFTDYVLLTEVVGQGYNDTNLVLGGTAAAPTNKEYRYRITRVTGSGEIYEKTSGVSNTSIITASPMPEGELAVGSVTAGKIDVENLSAISADLGDISAGRLFTTGDDPLDPQKSFINMNEGSIRMGTAIIGIEYDGVNNTFKIRGVEMELTESDLTTYKYTGDDRLSLSHEELSLAVRGVSGIVCDRVEYNRERSAFKFGRASFAPMQDVWSTKSLVLNEEVYYSSLIQQQDGTLRVLFKVAADDFLYEQTKTLTGVWSAKSLVLNEATYYLSLIQQQDGTLRVLFTAADGFLYEQTKTLTGTWSTKSPVLNEVIAHPSLIQQQDGTLRVLFKAAADDFLYEQTKTLTGVWSAKSLVLNEATYYLSLIQQQDGTLRVLFTLDADNKIYEQTKTLTGSWSAKSLVLNEAMFYSSLIQQQDGTLRVLFKAAADNKIYEQTKTLTGSWSAKSLVLNEAIDWPSHIQQQDGTLRVLFTLSADNKIYELTREMYAKVGGGFIAKGATDYTLFDGAKITVSGTSLTGYIGPQGLPGTDGTDGADGTDGVGHPVTISVDYPTVDDGNENDLWFVREA